jgi:dephospho-CoA kinase
MIRVGLTGNVASGKSEVARTWARAGVPVVSADELAREAVAPGSPALQEVVKAFGTQVLTPEGGLDRERVRELVFRDPEARASLEAILHPRIRELRDAWVRERAREGAPLVVSEVPLLYEAGLDEEFDVVVVVHAEAGDRRRRLMENRGMEGGEADRIMAAQGDPEEKRRWADHVLLNDGTLEELEARALALLERIRGDG